jgi:hypothetical protein
MLGLTERQRRETCFHEAGHAVAFALGGVNVFGVAVAPAGAQSWRTTNSNGRTCSDLWGLCRKAELILPRQLLRWLMNEGGLHADGKGHEAVLATAEGQALLESLTQQQQREILAQIVGLLAGPAAEQIFRGEEVRLCGSSDLEDVSRAAALSALLPGGAALAHAAVLTAEVLRRPELWAKVARLADELERSGEVDQRIKVFLPAAVQDWPHFP